MAIQTTSMRNSMAAAYGNLATHGAIYTTIPGASAGAELSGGSSAYSRKPLVWGTQANGVVTATAVFDVPAGQPSWVPACIRRSPQAITVAPAHGSKPDHQIIACA